MTELPLKSLLYVNGTNYPAQRHAPAYGSEEWSYWNLSTSGRGWSRLEPQKICGSTSTTNHHYHHHHHNHHHHHHHHYHHYHHRHFLMLYHVKSWIIFRCGNYHFSRSDMIPHIQRINLRVISVHLQHDWSFPLWKYSITTHDSLNAMS